MFDLKKRSSLTLHCGREADEFRRAAVRRRVKGAAAGDGHAAHAVSGGVCGTYSCGGVCDSLRTSGKHPAAEDGERSPAGRSSSKPQVPPKPAHLQTPVRAGQSKTRSPASGHGPLTPPHRTGSDRPPTRGCSVSVLYISPAGTCHGSPSPVRGGGGLVNGACGAAAHHPPGTPQVLGSPSPGKRGIHSCSPLRGDGGHSPAKLSPRNRSPLARRLRTPSPVQSRTGGYSPAKLSPRNHSPLARRLRTPSPVQSRTGGYSPAKSSRSWLGLHRIPRGKMEEKLQGKSVSVPDLSAHLDESRTPGERSPLKPLQSPNCLQRLVLPAEDAKDAANGEQAAEEKTPLGRKFSCQWGEVPPPLQGGRSQEEANGEEIKEGEGEGEGGVGGGGAEVAAEEEEEEEEDTENTEQKLFNIANELLQTEKAYVARLHLLDQVFCWRLTEEAGRGSFPQEVVRSIFSNISSIYSFHSQFLLPDLEDCISRWCEGPGLGRVLLQHAPFLRMYADYVRNVEQAMELVRSWSERSAAFRSVIHHIQSQEVCGSLTLQHHMLEPVQRVPRYQLLLRDYLKKLPEDNPDYEAAQKSLQTISMAATHSDSAIRKAESLKRLLEIYQMVGEEEEVINPTNEFIREGRLLKLAARNTSAMERHLFLFNNFLLCCSPKFCLVGQRYTVRCRIGVDGMQVQRTTNEDHPYTFQVSGKEKTLELQTSSEQDRDDWIKVIQAAIDEFQKKNETFKLASRELSVEEPVEELGRRAPRWIRDNEVTVCMKCQEPFNALTRRRHHCRACGCVVCWKCSDYKAALEYDGNRLNKVCKSCFTILTAPRGERGADGKKRRMLELEAPAVSGECLISGFLNYGDNPKSWQRVWSVIRGAEPPVLCLYASSQDVKPVSSLPLLGCSVDPAPPELHAQPGFSLRAAGAATAAHTFSCDGADLQRRWLDALAAAMAGEEAEITCINGEEFVVMGDKENRT